MNSFIFQQMGNKNNQIYQVLGVILILHQKILVTNLHGNVSSWRGE